MSYYHHTTFLNHVGERMLISRFSYLDSWNSSVLDFISFVHGSWMLLSALAEFNSANLGSHVTLSFGVRT